MTGEVDAYDPPDTLDLPSEGPMIVYAAVRRDPEGGYLIAKDEIGEDEDEVRACCKRTKALRPNWHRAHPLTGCAKIEWRLKGVV